MRLSYLSTVKAGELDCILGGRMILHFLKHKYYLMIKITAQ